MVPRLRVLVDVRPRLLADTLADAVRRGDIEVSIAAEHDVLIHDDSAYDLVVIDEAVRAARPARLTTRVRLDGAEGLESLVDLVDWLAGDGRVTAPDATPAGAPTPPQPAGS